jgi:hypothetical protein
MRARHIATSVAVVCLAFGSAQASAQTAPDGAASAGLLRLRIVEPPDNAIIPGSAIRVVIAREPEAAGHEETVLVFLDGVQQSSLRPNENHATLEGVAPGHHSVSALAIDLGNQVIDRRDVWVRTVEPLAAVSRSADQGILSPASNHSNAAAAVLVLLGLATIAMMVRSTRPRPGSGRRLGGRAAGRALVAVAALALCAPAEAQTDSPPARERPLAPSRTAVQPDPTGSYSGIASLTIEGWPPVLQQWWIDIQTLPCPECLPGQYFFSGTNFSGIAFVGGMVERGGVRGTLNPDGKAIDLTLADVNCVFINPSGSDRTYGGRTRGGSFGKAGDSPLVVANGSITGRISGHDCYGRSVAADISLQRQSGSVPPPCSSIQGAYIATYTNSLGLNGGGVANIVQDGCFFAADLPGIGARLEGVMTGPDAADIHVKDACATTVYDGSLTVSGSTLQGTYSGASGGAATTCNTGQVSGNFTFTHS